MRLVIDIPEKEYQNYLKMRPAYPKGVFCYIKAIQNGIVLPEGHGDLIDRNELLELIRMDGAYDYISAKEIADAPAIIKADKRQSEVINK